MKKWVPVKTGRKTGNCLGSCGNHDKKNRNIIALLNRLIAFETPWKTSPLTSGDPGITAAVIIIFLLTSRLVHVFARTAGKYADDANGTKIISSVSNNMTENIIIFCGKQIIY